MNATEAQSPCLPPQLHLGSSLGPGDTPPPRALHIFSSCHLPCSAVIARTLPSVCIFQRAGTNLTYRAAVTRGSALPPCISAAGPQNVAIWAASPQQCPWHSTGQHGTAWHSTPHLTTCHRHRASSELRFRIPAISHHLETTQSNNDNTPPKCSAGCILGQDLSEPPTLCPLPQAAAAWQPRALLPGRTRCGPRCLPAD